MKKQIGIWIDAREANVIHFKEEETHFKTITSEIEEFNPKGGSRSKQAYGPMDKISEKKYLNRKLQQMDAYLKSIIDQIKGVEELFIFGPANTKDQLQKMIAGDPSLSSIKLEVEPADSMTKNQKIAKTKEFFRSI